MKVSRRVLGIAGKPYVGFRKMRRECLECLYFTEDPDYGEICEAVPSRVTYLYGSTERKCKDFESGIEEEGD